MNPTSRLALVLGKWGAVTSVALLIAVLSCLSFLPGQWLLRSETLAAMFQYGWREAGQFVLLLAPLAGALAALLMAVAIRCRTYKEAQANATIVMLAISLLPMASMFSQQGESVWHRFLPALAQVALMARVLKGETPGLEQIVLPDAVCLLIAGAGVAYVARALRGAALR